MSYGIKIKNDSGHLLISSDIASYHFLGKVYASSVFKTVGQRFSLSNPTWRDACTNIIDRYMPTTLLHLAGAVVYNYYLTTFDEPLIFIKPGDYEQFYAAIVHNHYSTNSNGSKNWLIRVIHSGVNGAPATLYVFDNLLNTPVTASSEYALRIFNEYGQTTFDSTKKPLSILSTTNVIPPYCPVADCAWVDGAYGSDSDTGTPCVFLGSYVRWKGGHNWNTNNFYNSYTVNTGISRDSLAFFCPSLPQAGRWAYAGAKARYTASFPDTYYTARMEWLILAKAAFKILNGGVAAGWATYRAECRSTVRTEDDIFGGSGSPYLGPVPINNQTINYVEMPMLLLDTTLYD